MDKIEKSGEIQKVTFIGALLNTFLTALQLVTGVVFHSNALILDGIHSLSDLFTDIFVLAITKLGSAKPDKNHPYGHGRFETIGVVVLGSVLITVALLFAWENVERLRKGEALFAPEPWALIPPLVAIFGKELLFRHTIKVGKRLNARILLANAWHHRSDALSSVVVLAGVGIASLGFPWMDSVAAIGVAGFIAKVGIDFVWDSLKELVDTALDPEIVDKIQEEIIAVEGVKGVHNLRSRMVGDQAMVDVNIEVAPRLSVSEGHEIATRASKRILNTVPLVADVTAHTDIEHDHADEEGFFTTSPGESRLPSRTAVEVQLNPVLNELGVSSCIERIQLHYLGSRVHIEVLLNSGSCESSQALVEAARLALSKHDWFGSIQFWQKL